VSPAIDRLVDVLVESNHDVRLLSSRKAVFALDSGVGQPGVALNYVLLVLGDRGSIPPRTQPPRGCQGWKTGEEELLCLLGLGMEAWSKSGSSSSSLLTSTSLSVSLSSSEFSLYYLPAGIAFPLGCFFLPSPNLRTSSTCCAISSVWTAAGMCSRTCSLSMGNRPHFMNAW